MTSSSRIIREAEVPSDMATWHAPRVVETALAKPVPAPAQPDPAMLREQARQEGFEQGRAEGIAAGRAELAQHAELLQHVLDGLARPVQTLDLQFEEEMLALITAIARQLLRRELQIDPTHLVAIVREGLAALPAASVDIQVRLHPRDAEVIADLLQPGDEGRRWTIEPDPLMEQGGCRIVTETAQIDGRLDTQLGRVVAAMLEDERAASD
jgi:flagellar assembly protein FliH